MLFLHVHKFTNGQIFYYKVIFIIICISIGGSVQQPFVFENTDAGCSFNSSFNITSDIFTVEDTNTQITYSFCTSLKHNHINKCSYNAFACLKDKKRNKYVDLGTNFIYENNERTFLKYVNGSHCKKNINYSLTVSFKCFDSIKNFPQLLKSENDCDFEIIMRNNTCQPKCTAIFNNHFIDLRNFTENVEVTAKSKKFNIQICGQNKICGNDTTACEINNDSQITPISTAYTQHVNYNFDNYGLHIKGHYKENTIRKTFELNIECNWQYSNISFKEVPNPGEKSLFKMESIYGCVKFPQDCMISDNWFQYNLSALYRPDGWKVSNITHGILLLNICGPLHISKNNKCSDTHSQICEIVNEEYVNKGSIFSKFEVKEDTVLVNILYGVSCKENNLIKYSTKIEFECSQEEYGPHFEKYEECVTHLKWKTPLACPYYVNTSCNYIKPQIINCTYQINDLHYDLSPLMRNGSYIVKDDDENVEYLLNVCSPVFDKEAPCEKDFMSFIRRIDQPNLKHRLTPLNKVVSPSIKNGDLVIESSFGKLCTKSFMDFKTIIRFHCGETVGKPELYKKSDCSYEFVWKTVHACKTCEIETDIGTKYNLNFFTSKNITLNNKFNTTINICKDYYMEWFEGIYHKLPLSRKLVLKAQTPYFIFNLSKTCTSNGYNKIIFTLSCHLQKDNNLQFKAVRNCALEILMFSSQFCKLYENNDIPVRIFNVDEFNTSKITSKNNLSECFVSDDASGYKQNINDLYEIRTSLPLDCPKIFFNKTGSSINFSYKTDIVCDPIEQKNMDYIVTVRCFTENDSIISKLPSEDCKQFYELKEHNDICKHFESQFQVPSESSALQTALISSSICIILIITCGILYWRYKTKRQNYGRCYVKDSDL